MSTFFIGRGACRLGTVSTDAAGNVVKQTGAEWEPDVEGGCIAICDIDLDKMELTGAAEIFGDWDAARFLARVLEKLGPGRPVNVPDFRAILKAAMCGGADEDFYCEYCKKYGHGYSCRDCIVMKWKEETEE